MLVRKLTGEKPRTPLPVGTVDTQLHIYLEGFPALPGGPGLPIGTADDEAYLRAADWLGVDRFVVTVANAYQHDNSCLIEVLRRLGRQAVGVAAISAEASDAELQSLQAAGVVGARVMDLPGGAVKLDQLEEVDARVSNFGLALAVQFDGSFIENHEARLASLKSRYVIDHHGKFFSGATPESAQINALKRLIDKGNCWFKFAGCYESSLSGGPDYADVAAVARDIARYAPERVVWGTNWPHNDAIKTEDYPDDAELVDLVLGWVPAAFQKRLLVDNPCELFQICAQSQDS